MEHEQGIRQQQSSELREKRGKYSDPRLHTESNVSDFHEVREDNHHLLNAYEGQEANTTTQRQDQPNLSSHTENFYRRRTAPLVEIVQEIAPMDYRLFMEVLNRGHAKYGDVFTHEEYTKY